MKISKTVVFVLIVLWCAAAHATTFYVAPDGSDSGPGTRSDPYRTIHKGARQLRAGDTLIISGGTYVEPSLSNKIASGTSWDNPVILKAEAGEKVIFKPTTRGYPGISIRQKKRFIRIEGLTLDASEIVNTNGIKIHEQSSDIQLINIEIKNTHGNRGSALVVGEGSQRVVVRGCKIHDVQQDPPDTPGNHGIYWRGNDGLIEHCLFYNVEGYAIQFYSSKGNLVNNNTARYNRIYNTGQDALREEGGVTVGAGSGNKIHGNLIYEGARTGIRISNSDNEITRNTIYRNKGTGIYVSQGDRNIIEDNILYRNLSPIYDGGSRTIIRNNFTGDPEFVDPANGDFRLRSGSDALSRGVGAF